MRAVLLAVILIVTGGCGGGENATGSQRDSGKRQGKNFTEQNHVNRLN